MLNEEMLDTRLSDESVEDDLNNRYLTFFIDDAIYGISLTHVMEIISIQSITCVPAVSDYYVKGIINLRGKVVPILDVRLKFGLMERPYDDKTCIVVVTVNDEQIGLIVDSVSEVVTIYNSRVAAPPGSNGLSERYISGIAEINETVVMVINFKKFFQADFDGF